MGYHLTFNFIDGKSVQNKFKHLRMHKTIISAFKTEQKLDVTHRADEQVKGTGQKSQHGPRVP